MNIKCRNGKLLFALLMLLAFAGSMDWGVAGEVTIDAGLAKEYLLKGAEGKNYLKISIKGNPRVEGEKHKAPQMNLAIVIDRSGSMQGSKIEHARQAAAIAVNQLRDDDVVSVLAYSDTVEVIVPATKATDRQQIVKKIMQIQATGSTALYAGVEKGAAEVRKFLTKQRVNRVVLLSDGQANVGPSSPGELGDFGASLAKEGIAVSTVGLGYGYNENLMAELAKRSEGNFLFAENPEQLASLFDKGLDGARKIRCREARISITFPEYVKPSRCLGRKAKLGEKVATGVIREVYEGNEKFLLVELDVRAEGDKGELPLAEVEVSYDSMETGKTVTVKKLVKAAVSEDKTMVEKQFNETVQESVVTLIANERNNQVLALRDAGKIEEANSLNLRNDAYLKTQKKLMPFNKMIKQALEYNSTQKEEINKSEREYRSSGRKSMLRRQEAKEKQMEDSSAW